MATEIEVKFRLADPGAMREKLKSFGARPRGARLEHNAYFDTPEASLRRGDCGLRIRVEESPDGSRRAVLTYKGPRRPGPLKIRQEEETAIGDFQAAQAILEGLGFHKALAFQKRRESYELAGAKVELDELPELGHFIEIEAGDEKTVQAVRDRLHLADEPTITDTYSALVARHLGSGGRMELRFP